MVLVCAPSEAEALVAQMTDLGEEARIIGHVTDRGTAEYKGTLL